MVAASIDPVPELNVMREAAGSTFDFYSDPEGRLIELTGTRHAGAGPNGVDLPQSSSFLIDGQGKILWSHLAANYRVRPRPSTILAVVDGLP